MLLGEESFTKTTGHVCEWVWRDHDLFHTQSGRVDIVIFVNNSLDQRNVGSIKGKRSVDRSCHLASNIHDCKHVVCDS